MSSTAFDTSASGIQAAAAKMQATANNVANADTNGYQAQRVDLVERPGGVEARSASVDAPNRADAAADSNRTSPVSPRMSTSPMKWSAWLPTKTSIRRICRH